MDEKNRGRKPRDTAPLNKSPQHYPKTMHLHKTKHFRSHDEIQYSLNNVLILGEDPCDMIHNVPDRCETRSNLQRPEPGEPQPLIGPNISQ